MCNFFFVSSLLSHCGCELWIILLPLVHWRLAHLQWDPHKHTLTRSLIQNPDRIYRNPIRTPVQTTFLSFTIRCLGWLRDTFIFSLRWMALCEKPIFTSQSSRIPSSKITCLFKRPIWKKYFAWNFCCFLNFFGCCFYFAFIRSQCERFFPLCVFLTDFGM